MKTYCKTAAWLVAALVGGNALASETCVDGEEAKNKETIRAFYDAAINEKDFEKASQYFGDRYTQHNPMAADGPEGLKNFLEFAKASLPNYRTEFKRFICDGDFVVVHAHARATPEDRGSAVMDIFMLENGKVVEHWDVIQAIPEQANNDNGMF